MMRACQAGARPIWLTSLRTISPRDRAVARCFELRRHIPGRYKAREASVLEPRLPLSGGSAGRRVCSRVTRVAACAHSLTPSRRPLRPGVFSGKVRGHAARPHFAAGLSPGPAGRPRRPSRARLPGTPIPSHRRGDSDWQPESDTPAAGACRSS